MWWGSSNATIFNFSLLWLRLQVLCLEINHFLLYLVNMEPSEEAIVSFTSFTSTTRDQAIAFLKVTPLLFPKGSSLAFC